MELHDKDALITHARNADRPIAFLVGAPLSEDAGGGVPSVSPMLALVRAEVNARDSSQLPRYDATLAGKTSGEAYQAALAWLQGNFGQNAVNHVVATAVVKARKASSSGGFNGDGAPSDWYIPAGTRQLALLACSDLERFPGPIITTNFDPLLSLAIEEAGGHARLRVIQSDGGLAHDVRRVGEINVVHLHGYWRDTDTLHTPAQLTAPRSRLKASLQQVLKQRILIVAAYGGWDDVFAQALAEVAVDDASQVNILWCFRDTEVAEVERKYKLLLERVAPAVTRGRFLTYGGIDCHSIFAEIQGVSPTAYAARVTPASPLVGWDRIDSGFLGALPPLRPEEVIRYFDGAVPTWRHAVSAAIPRRQALSEVAGRLAALQNGKSDCSLQLIRAAGGEGKTTLLLHAARDAVNSGKWTVLWRQSPRVSLPPEQVANLDTAKQWLIVADDAENLVPDLRETARLLHESGHSNVHFLLAARDADWRFVRGDSPPWDTWLKRHRDILLRGISPNDASAIVKAWRKCGAEGLRELSQLSEVDQQVAALLNAVKDAAKVRDEGSLFGGLLAVRFGQNGLQAHVRTFLNRLKEEPIEGSGRTLFDALVYVAACHAVGVPGINETVLADLIEMPRDWIQSRVVRQLGEEAAAVPSAGHVLTRHSKVAAAILVECEQSFDIDIAEVWSAIVRQTVQTSRDVQIGQTFSPIVHAGPRLQFQLPQQLPEARRKEIAMAAAKAAAANMTEWLGCVVDLGKTYRNAGSFIDAVQVFRDNLPSVSTKVDFSDVIRGYWYEWGMAEGSFGDAPAHRGADAWLQGLSISDWLDPAPLVNKNGEAEQPKRSCAGLGIAFGKLAQAKVDCPFARGRRAVAYVGRLVTSDEKAIDYFNRYDREADKIHTPYPGNDKEAIAWLKVALAKIGRELQDPFLAKLAEPASISFRRLESLLLIKRKAGTLRRRTRQETGDGGRLPTRKKRRR